MSKKSMYIIGVLVLSVAAAAYLLWETGSSGQTTGTVEVTKYAVTSRIPGYIRNLTLKEGANVQAGDLICLIERDDLKAQVAEAEAALAQAEAALADAESGSRSQEVLMAESRVKSAEFVKRQALEDFRRYEELAAQNAISQQQLDAARTHYEVAEQELKAAREAYDLTQAGSRPDQIAARRADVARKQALVESSKTLAADTEIKAPAAGTIISKNFENNEFVPAGVPILTIADLGDCWVRVYVPTEELPKIHVGQQVKIYVDGLAQARAGHVDEIAEQAEFTPRQSITKRERANLVFRIKIRIDNEDGVMKPGMPADVVFE